ncbi:hypothetical protein B7494_g2859 [Chlorociboria aeruginascens]|nr:hypothetical protein B7494_g2859 [Chlorociboria aeruginascens]
MKEAGALTPSTIDLLSSEPKYLSSWWNSEDLFETERRAVFSKTWLFVTHISRFHKPGDYRTFEIAGFSILLILGKDQQLRAFHNVCRHRAYAVAKKEFGSSTVLGCRYHGWSYDTQGRLTKAPEFENVDGFDKSLNNLWELKTEICGPMVFVNFNAEKVSKLDLYDETDLVERLAAQRIQCIGEWKIQGRFNWKLGVGEFSLDEQPGSSKWWILPGFKSCQELRIGNSIIIQLPSNQLLTVRFLPNSATRTTMEFNLYKKVQKIAAWGDELRSLRERTQLEIDRLQCKQIDIFKWTDHFNKEQQDKFRDIIRAHLDEERELGGEIYPAAQKQNFTATGKEDDDFCKEVEGRTGQESLCSASAKGLLDW